MNNNIDEMHFLVLHVGEAHCMKDWNYKNVCSPFTRIYYVTKGHAQIKLPDKNQDICILFRPLPLTAISVMRSLTIIIYISIMKRNMTYWMNYYCLQK